MADLRGAALATFWKNSAICCINAGCTGSGTLGLTDSLDAPPATLAGLSGLSPLPSILYPISDRREFCRLESHIPMGSFIQCMHIQTLWSRNA
ncbi:hypothetical protein ACOSQ4_012250 [Xanthoceras sorbifolium]